MTLGGSLSQEVASLEANGGRTADQRMMVNGVALSSMIAGGWGGGAVPNATGTSEFAIDVSAVEFIRSHACPTCSGSGRVIETPCEVCKGEGRVRVLSAVDGMRPATRA